MITINLEDLMQDGLSQFDLQYLTEIIRENYGTWFHADLMRCLHLLLPHADSKNFARLERAFPGSVAAYRIWFNYPMELAQAAGREP